MSKLKEIVRYAEVFTRNNASSILTGSSIAGLVTTAYFTGHATVKTMRAVFDQEIREHRPVSKKEMVQQHWTKYIPAGISATATVVSIVGSNRITARRTAALTAAYSLTEKAFSEYKEKVIETLGDKKEKKIQEAIAQDRINSSAPPTNTIVIGGDNVLCYEMHTGRYFQCDIEMLRRAQNSINAQLISQMEATLSDFYYFIGLPQTSSSSYSGWSSDKMLDLKFTSLLADGKPCLAFDYNYVKVF